MIAPSPHPSPQRVNCPRCKRHAMIQRTEDLYVCLNCRYRDDRRSESDVGGWLKYILALIGLLFVIALL